jgi:hypothetical protein
MFRLVPCNIYTMFTQPISEMVKILHNQLYRSIVNYVLNSTYVTLIDLSFHLQQYFLHLY